MIKKIIKYFIPKRILNYYWRFLSRKYYKDINKYHKKAILSVRKKETIKCVIIALYDSTWKFDKLYELLKINPLFEPIILVCPIIDHGEDHMIKEMNNCFNSLCGKNYNVIKSYDDKSKCYIDLRKDLKPDIIFYTNPYKGLIDNRYYIDNFQDLLTIYLPYYFNGAIDNEHAYNLELHKIVWRYYVETDFHKFNAYNYLKIRKGNIKVTGYPGIDKFLDKTYKPTYKWKNKNNKLKRIIWAPHQTIEAVWKVNYSCFLSYSDFMLKMAKKYENQAQWVFKPHPLLRGRLIKKWGEEKTNNYYKEWEMLPNTTIETGEYSDLFLTSDALIHDCGSFIIEYLYLNKPVMRTFNDIDPKEMFNEFGLECIDMHYKAYNEQDIEHFIQNVIDGVDPMKEAREKFYQERLLPPNGKLPSENIVNDIIDSIKNQRVLAD